MRTWLERGLLGQAGASGGQGTLHSRYPPRRVPTCPHSIHARGQTCTSFASLLCSAPTHCLSPLGTLVSSSVNRVEAVDLYGLLPSFSPLSFRRAHLFIYLLCVHATACVWRVETTNGSWCPSPEWLMGTATQLGKHVSWCFLS